MSWADLIEALGDREAWRADAACRGMDVNLMFPTSISRKGSGSYGPQMAREVCEGCSVRRECLDTAVEHDERYGCWGGYTGRELRAQIHIHRRELRRIEMAS